MYGSGQASWAGICRLLHPPAQSRSLNLFREVEEMIPADFLPSMLFQANADLLGYPALPKWGSPDSRVRSKLTFV